MVDCALLLVLVTLLGTNIIYGLASPFLPTVIEMKDIDNFWTGIIFAAYAVSATFTSIIIGKVLGKFGHNRIMTLGAFLMAGAIASFGFIEEIDEAEYVIILSVSLRLLQGKYHDKNFSLT